MTCTRGGTARLRAASQTRATACADCIRQRERDKHTPKNSSWYILGSQRTRYEDNTAFYSNASALFLFYFGLLRGQRLSERVIPPTAEEEKKRNIVSLPEVETRYYLTHRGYETISAAFRLTHSRLHDRPRTKHDLSYDGPT